MKIFQKEGRLTQCNRCGKMIFSERLKDGETDGGYTSFSRFADNLAGWVKHQATGYLCPKCEAEYKIYIKDFFMPYDLKANQCIEGFNDSEEDEQK